MIRRLLSAAAILVSGIVMSGCGATAAAPQRPVCAALPGQSDRAGAIQACLDRAPPGATVRLRPGRYRLEAPLTVRQALTLTTADDGDTGCTRGIAAHCATLAIGTVAGRMTPTQMPIEIAAANVTFANIAIDGMQGSDTAYHRRICHDPAMRPAGGGIRVRAPHFTLNRAVIAHVACYTAMEVTKGADGLVVTNSRFLANGHHVPDQMWSDGLTIHDIADARVADTVFVDNTDVQLILGGCRRCMVSGNTLRHGGSVAGASFADLMLQSWPTTSGDFTGSRISGNVIDCGIQRRCGYGIMIGSNPWYAGRASGGTVSGNRVSSAMIGLNVDTLTGPMTITGNTITGAGGRFASDCGIKDWPSVNIAAAATPFLRGDATAESSGHMPTTGCLLNRQPD